MRRSTIVRDFVRRRPRAKLSHALRRPLRAYPRVPVAQPRAPETQAAKPRAWLLLSVTTAGLLAYTLTVTALENPFTGLDQLLREVQFVIAPAPATADTGELLVPRAEGLQTARVAVPTLLGLSRNDAEAAASSASFRVVFDEGFSETISEDLVSEQTPSPGAMQDTDKPIRATMSLGRPQAAVPNVVGLPAAAARARLEASGFQVLAVAAFSQDVPADVVLRQAPIADSIINRRSSVALHVSRGIETVSVPPLEGRSEDDARRALELAGLAIGKVTYKETGSVPNGVVESQDPAAGDSIERGSYVELIVVRVGEVVMPELVGMDDKAAERELLDRGLFIGALTRLPTAGVTEPHVVEQEPGAGARVPRGLSIRMTVAIPGGDLTEPPSG